MGLAEYETRTPYQVRGRLWAGWHHHIALCLVAGAFLLSLQQAWGGKDAEDSPGPRSTEWCGEMLPRKSFGPDELLRWLEETQLRNERARLSPRETPAPPVEHRQASLPEPVVVILVVQLL